MTTLNRLHEAIQQDLLQQFNLLGPNHLGKLACGLHVFISIQAQSDWFAEVVSRYSDCCIQEHRPRLLPSKTTTYTLRLAHNFVLWYSQYLGNCHSMLVGSLSRADSS